MRPSVVPPVALLALIAVAGGPRAQEDGELLARYERLSAGRQVEVLEAVRDAVRAVGDPYLGELRALAGRARDRLAEDVRGLRWRSPRREGASEGSAWPLPLRYRYLWGWHAVMADEAVGRRSPRPRSRAEQREQRLDELRALLLGLPVDADLIVAGLLAELDRDRAGDDLARFLEAWRNGEESFYEALDRTAGTPEAVFFYDAMLEDFRGKVVHEAKHRASLRSLQATHDALHRSFLAYRQYRALREAIALTLVLPPSEALPRRLARYGDPDGGYSTRDLVLAVVGAEGRSPQRFLERFLADAEPLPHPLWAPGYEPWRTLHELFDARSESMIEQAGHTDDFIAGEKAWREDLAGRIASAVREALRAALEGDS